jgi:hypothetical protein
MEIQWQEKVPNAGTIGQRDRVSGYLLVDPVRRSPHREEQTVATV